MTPGRTEPAAEDAGDGTLYVLSCAVPRRRIACPTKWIARERQELWYAFQRIGLFSTKSYPFRVLPKSRQFQRLIAEENSIRQKDPVPSTPSPARSPRRTRRSHPQNVAS
jgi:hypothetical protein